MNVETSKTQNDELIKHAEGTSEWTLDQSHSHLYFTARHMLIANVKGEFEDFDAHFTMEGNNLETAVVEVEIQVNSLNTRVADRDNHLRSADFFDAENHAQAIFKSSEIVKTEADIFRVKGELTLRGITKPITLQAELGGIIKDSWGNDRMGLAISGKINRFDYDLKWNNLLETGGAVVGQDIRIQADVEFIKKATSAE